MRTVLGVIGGSGIYDLPGLQAIEDQAIETPWGSPSDHLRRGRIGGTEVVFLARHGRGHRIPPSQINYRANIDALKRAGVTDLVALSACGSYRADLAPGMFVLADQFVDRTYRRESSFFGAGCVAHVAFAHPVSPGLQSRVADAARAESIEFRMGGVYVCMEGPQFSTLAESLAYKAQGFDLIGMTAMPEAKLAREAELKYALVAMVTDYDAWHPHHDAVDAASVVEVMHANSEKARRLVARLAAGMPEQSEPCSVNAHRALDGAIMTAPSARDPQVLKMLDVVAGPALARQHRQESKP
jgi:5'-methylthioadenosine phosphorylase